MKDKTPQKNAFDGYFRNHSTDGLTDGEWLMERAKRPLKYNFAKRQENIEED